MKTRRVILVDGTHGTRRDHDWIDPQHPFARTLLSAGCVPVSDDRPFCWDTNLDGVFGKNDTWIAAGANLFTYAVPVLCPDKRVPSDELLVIAFSHGGNVALNAFAMGLKGALITVNPPVRADMLDVAKSASKNIRAWINVYGDFRDVWALFGQLGDGSLTLRRKFDQAHNVLVAGKHGAALRDTQHAGKWAGWIDEVMA